MTTTEIIRLLLGGLGVAIVTAFFSDLAAKRKASSDEKVAKLKADTEAQNKAVDGEVLLRAKIIDDGAAWRQHLVDQIDRLEKKIANSETANAAKIEALELKYDSERTERRKLESQLHDAQIRIADMTKEIADLQEAGKADRTKIVRLQDDNRRRQDECEDEIRKVHDENLDLRQQLETAKGQRDALQTQLDVLSIASHIGEPEMLERKRKE